MSGIECPDCGEWRSGADFAWFGGAYLCSTCRSVLEHVTANDMAILAGSADACLSEKDAWEISFREKSTDLEKCGQQERD